MSDNYSPLERNVLDYLQTEEAQKEFLWAREQKWADRYAYRCEAHARNIDKIFGAFDFDGIRLGIADQMKQQGVDGDFSPANLIDQNNPSSLKAFIIKRARVLFSSKFQERAA